MSSLKVRDLLNTPNFGLTLVAGSEGLDNTIAWAHISEMEDPAPWLDGGEFLMANGWGVPRAPANQANYVRRLSESGAAGVALGIHASPLEPEMLDAANALGFPVLRIAREVPFVTIARMVSAHTQDVSQRRLASHVRMFDSLRLLTDHNISPGRLMNRLEEISGYTLYLMSNTGRQLIPNVPAPPPDQVESVLNPTRPLPGIEGGYAVTVPVAGRTAGYLVAIEREDVEPAGLTAVRHVTTVAAILLTALYRDRADQRRSGARVLELVMRGEIAKRAIDSELQALGFSGIQDYQLAAVRQVEGSLDPALIHHPLADAGIPCAISAEEDQLLLLVPAAGDPFALLLDQEHLRIGVSSNAKAPADWSLKRTEAIWALQYAESRDVPVVQYSASTWNHWLPPDMTALSSLATRVLGPIDAYDEENGSDLLNSLITYLSNERKLAVSAGELFVHKHTLAYRLRRIEEITGRSLSETEDLAEFWLAIKARGVIRSRNG